MIANGLSGFNVRWELKLMGSVMQSVLPTSSQLWLQKPEATVTQILGISLRQRSSPPDMQAMCTHSSSQLNTRYWQAQWTIITSPPIHTYTNTQLTRPVCEAAIMESIVPLYFLPTLSATEHNNASVQSKTICLHYLRDE